MSKSGQQQRRKKEVKTNKLACLIHNENVIKQYLT